MDQSLTSSAKSADSLLAARDTRQEALVRHWGKGQRATIFLSLNVPGSNKRPAGTQTLFDGVLHELDAAFAGIVRLVHACDALGPYAIDPVTTKTRCIGLEMQSPAARLVDLDVYSPAGVQIDRGRLGFPPRRCFVCPQAAAECMRTQRHSYKDVIAKAHALLSHF